MSADLIETVARAWASLDGRAERFDACKADPAAEEVEGHYLGYRADAETLLERSGLLVEIPKLKEENADLSALVQFAYSIFINRSVEDGCCCCGDSMEGHAEPMTCGHVATDNGQYAASQWLEASGPVITAYEERLATSSREVAK